MKKKKVVKEERKPFDLTVFTELSVKVLIKRYESFGFKHITSKYDSKREVYIVTFK